MFLRFGVRVVLVGGEGFESMATVTDIFKNCETEEIAVARLTSELQAGSEH